ncbi:DUF7224 domain-containing protein [Streptomyces spiramenti]|uniref:DUF7224 domain-containing protein n=1 Tax=Streptomyces spiramenti TaxID=2720606 RepID=A0ABX1APQ8_9ACTN|nr:hypothetical protein [Streptomyces spiramenti]NJP69059.1 hypothetical protein [Streptomyces spiramenti]
MVFRLRLRANAAFVAAGPLLAVVLLYVFAEEVGGGPGGYWVAGTAKAASALMFVAPAVAACAAWEAGRLRRAGVAGGTPVRGGFRIAAASLIPVLAMGLLALLVALVGVRAGMTAAPGWPEPVILAAAVVTLCGWLAVGYALGVWLPPAASVPVALVGGYLWQVYPPALEPLWLRHLTQPARGCCAAAESVAAGGVSGPALAAVALTGTAVAAAVLSRRTPRRGAPGGARSGLVVAAALLVAVAAGVGAVRAVSGLGPDAVVARSADELVCVDAGGATRVCVWAEHAPRLDETAEVVRAAVAGLAPVGVDPPELVTELPGEALAYAPTAGAANDGAPSTGTPDRWTVTVRTTASFTTDDIRTGLAADLTGALLDAGTPATDCPADPVDAAEQGFQAADQLFAWLTVRAGAPPQEARDRFEPQLWTAVGAALEGDDAAQAAWFRATLARAGCAPR